MKEGLKLRKEPQDWSCSFFAAISRLVLKCLALRFAISVGDFEPKPSFVEAAAATTRVMKCTMNFMIGD
jgi:hypothetical protein